MSAKPSPVLAASLLSGDGQLCLSTEAALYSGASGLAPPALGSSVSQACSCLPVLTGSFCLVDKLKKITGEREQQRVSGCLFTQSYSLKYVAKNPVYPDLKETDNKRSPFKAAHRHLVSIVHCPTPRAGSSCPIAASGPPK